jgi:Protein of unknown function (DUF2778)
MWTWDQSAGTISRDGKVVGRGYAGHDYGKNNPDAEEVKGIGPLPRGRWTICAPRTSQNTGPYTLDLIPAPETETHGRAAFRIHGDSIANPGTASHGCIILARSIREAVWSSGDHILEVVE